MTPTEARALADRLGNRARWHSAKGGDTDGHWIENDAAKALRSLADQVEALQGQALSSVEREEYFKMKRDAGRYRWLRAHRISGPMHDLRWLLPRDCSLDGDGLDEAIDRAREAT